VKVNSGGILAPGVGITAVFNAGAVMLASGSTFTVNLNGTTPGTSYDQLNATGTVTLSGATLIVNVNLLNTAAGDTFTIVQSTTSVVGTFASLPNGATFTVGAATFTISYGGKTVVLTRTA